MISKNVSIIIPAYEPDEKLINLLIELKDVFYGNIIIVNDGSTNKKSMEVLKEVDKFATILTHNINKGKGASIKTALLYIKNNLKNTTCIVTVDADGQHKVSDIRNVYTNFYHYQSNLHSNKILIIGSRKFTGDVPLKSKMGNTITRYIFKLISKKFIWDTQSGLRAFGFEMINFLLDTRGERYDYEMNVLLDCVKSNIEIIETQIKTIYIQDNESSHFRVVKDSILIYKELFKFSLSSMASFIVDYSLYTLLNIFTANVLLSNILARVISASFNFTINKKYVYESKDNIFKEGGRYFILALFILVVNTIFLNFIINNTYINQYLAKLIVELVLFLVSYIIQRRFIFYSKKGDII